MIDIYYSETSMNNFKASVLSQVDKLNAKMREIERDFVDFAKAAGSPIQAARGSSELQTLKARFEGEL